jgi:hypothetical protein
VEHSDQLQLRVPPHIVRYFDKDERCEDAVDGDIVVIRHDTIFAKVIAEAQKLENKLHHNLDGFTEYDHTAFVRGKDENGRIMLSEMGPRGYERRQIWDYDHLFYAVIHYEVSDELRTNGVLNDIACSNVDYGWSQYIGDVIDGIDNGKFSITFGDAIVCSCHVTLCAMAMGLMPDRPPSDVIPALIAKWHGAIYNAK